LNNYFGDWRELRIQEIENALSRFKACPKCGFLQGFWLGVKSDKAYVQCKGCGAKFEISEVYMLSESDKEQKRFNFLKK
jgi:transcription elongation factor Elf1